MQRKELKGTFRVPPQVEGAAGSGAATYPLGSSLGDAAPSTTVTAGRHDRTRGTDCT
jgi:hypothetical protein